VVYDERIYLAPVSMLLEVVQEIPEQITTLLLVGHHPGLYRLAQFIVNDEGHDLPVEEDFTTCTIAELSFTGPWAELTRRTARIPDSTWPAAIAIGACSRSPPRRHDPVAMTGGGRRYATWPRVERASFHPTVVAVSIRFCPGLENPSN